MEDKDLEQYRALYLANIPGIAFVADMAFHPVLLEGKVEEITGYAPEEFLKNGRAWNSIIHPEDRFDPDDASQEPLNKGSGLEHEYRIVRADGQVRWLHESIGFILDERGRPHMVRGTCMDITRRKEMEEAAHETELRFRALFDHSAEGILVADAANKNLLYANPRICEMLGYTEEELLDLSVYLIHPPELMEQIIDQFNRQFHGEMVMARDTPCLRKDGSLIYADISSTSAILDGRPCNVGFFQDATDRRKIRHDLAQRMEELRRLIDLSRYVAQAITPKEVLEVAVRELREALRVELVVGGIVENGIMSVVEVHNDLLRGPMDLGMRQNIGECLCEMAARDGKPQFLLDIERDSRCTRTQCVQAGVKSYAAMPLEREGEVIGVLGVGAVEHRDFVKDSRILESMASIVATGLAKAVYHERLSNYSRELETKVEQRTRELAKSEERFRAIFEQVEDIIVILDMAGNCIDVNEYAEAFLGYSREELRSMNVQQFTHPEDMGIMQRMIKDAGKGVPQRGEFRVFLKSGEVAHLEAHGKRIGNHIIGLARDVTERKRVEQLKEDVGRMMRHDLKSPLNAVINLPPICWQDHVVDDEVRQMLEMVHESGQRMLNLVDMSLRLYQMETGTYRLEPEDVDLAEVLRKVVREMEAKSSQWRVLLQSGGKPLTDGKELMARGDELLCHSLFANLVGNALEASEPGEQVAVNVDLGEQCVVTIHNARPVPKMLRQTFFDKYATQGKVRGTGLGTYNAKLMAEAMGGGVTMETSRAKGTTLTVTLPRGGN